MNIFLLKMVSVKKEKYYFLIIMLMVCNVIFIKSAAAVCIPFREILTAPASVNMNPSLPIGSVVASMTVSWARGGSGGYNENGCDVPYNTSSGLFVLVGDGTPNGNLYPTDMSGLAYRGKITSGWYPSLQTYWPLSTTLPVGSEGYGAGSALVEFVKTGPIQPGAFSSRLLMHASIQGVPWFELYLSSPVIIQPVVPTCTVTQSAIPVNLEDVNSSQLAAIGSTSKDQAFSIPLTCTASANIALNFSGDVADATNAVFRNLSGSANASTVGVQILSGGTPVPTAAGTFLNLGATNGSKSVPLVARYYALANNPDVGAVSAIAYATIVYN